MGLIAGAAPYLATLAVGLFVGAVIGYYTAFADMDRGKARQHDAESASD